jgi:hypothetical protein
MFHLAVVSYGFPESPGMNIGMLSQSTAATFF